MRKVLAGAVAVVGVVAAGSGWADEDCFKLADKTLYRDCLERRNEGYVKPLDSVNEDTIKSAAVVLGLTMQTDGEIVIDSESRAHLQGTNIIFKKIGTCTYIEQAHSLGGERYLVVNFNKLTFGYGYYRNEIVVSGGSGERAATCFQYDTSGERCSGSLHVQRGVDEALLMYHLHNVQKHGCDDGVKRGL